MHHTKHRTRILFSITILAIALTIVGTGQALVEPVTSKLAGQENCSIVVNVDGNGHVQIDQVDHEIQDVTSSIISVACNEALVLTAEPEGPWVFERWLGVDEPRSLRETIILSAPASITAVFRPREVTYIPVDEPYYNRRGELVDTIAVYEEVWQPLDSTQSRMSQSVAPEIQIWYGSSQPYGQPGVAQQYFDILGTVSDQDKDIASLEYTLNDSVVPVALHYGGDTSEADGRRLWNQGDFIVNLHVDDLKPGANQVSITATDSANNSVTEIVEVNYIPEPNGWQLPSNVDWNSTGSSPNNILNVAQIVDGKWEIVEDGVRTTETGYDRLLNIGMVRAEIPYP